tara:strand:+ start:26278 stop:26496 length:219 start_codon:yes stop_codon:yes gene_type:complete
MKGNFLKVLVMLSRWYVICSAGVLIVVLNFFNLSDHIPMVTGLILISMGLLDLISGREDIMPFKKQTNKDDL